MALSSSDMEFLYSIAAGMFPDKVPAWIANHKAIKDRKEKKVFPAYGLHNFRERANIAPEDLSTMREDISSSVMAGVRQFINFAVNIVNESTDEFMEKKFAERQKQLDIELANSDFSSEKQREIKEREIKLISIVRDENRKIINYNELLTNTLLSFSSAVHQIISDPQEDGRLKLLLGLDVLAPDGKKICDKGTSLAKSYGKIRNIVQQFLKSIGENTMSMTEYDFIPAVKDFNAKNTPVLSSNFEVVFSASGDTGAWDIATMSMRGLTSCQDWSDSPNVPGRYNACIIGSIASNYVGLIYLTNGKDWKGLGEKMIKRCVVRFGIDVSKPKKERKPVIILDRMFDSPNLAITKAFIKAIKSKTSLEVLDYTDHENPAADSGVSQPDVMIPKENLPNVSPSNSHRHLEEDNFGYESYQDTEFPALNKEEIKELDGTTTNPAKIKRKEIEKIRTAGDVVGRYSMRIFTFVLNSLPIQKEMDKTTFEMEMSRELHDLTFNAESKTVLINTSYDFVIKYLLMKVLKLELPKSDAEYKDTGIIMEKFRSYIKQLIDTSMIGMSKFVRELTGSDR
jgi:hypothetical protein